MNYRGRSFEVNQSAIDINAIFYSEREDAKSTIIRRCLYSTAQRSYIFALLEFYKRDNSLIMLISKGQII